MSKALECVTNGRAAAPPWIVCSIGVSTWAKPQRASAARNSAMTVMRVRAILRASGRMMRST